MSNPPPYPGTTLTEKFTALATDVEQYIATVNNKLDSIIAAQGVSNTALAAIAAALSALGPVMQQAADCSCAAAAALEDAPWNVEEPPPTPACDDLDADPELLTFNESIGFGPNFWYEDGATEFANMGVLVPSTGFTVNDNGQQIVLPGPSWYKFVFNKVGTEGSVNFFGSGGGDQELTITVTDTAEVVRYFYVIGPEFNVTVYLDFGSAEPSEYETLRLSSFAIGICDGSGGGPS